MLMPPISENRQKTVLITGSAKRLGRHIALQMAAHGWRIAVHYGKSCEEAKLTADECSRMTAGAASFSADLSNEISTHALVPDVVQAFGHLDAIVNNASIFEYDSVNSFSYDMMFRHMSINTGAAIHLANALHQHACEHQKSGVVVNLLDQKLWNSNPDFLSYTLSKASLEAATTMLSLALAPHIRVVGVAPGLTLSSDFLSATEFERLHQLSPLKRSSTAEDVASTVHFACTNQSITGTTLLVDGGQHLHKFDRDFSMMGKTQC